MGFHSLPKRRQEEHRSSRPISFRATLFALLYLSCLGRVFIRIFLWKVGEQILGNRLHNHRTRKCQDAHNVRCLVDSEVPNTDSVRTGGRQSPSVSKLPASLWRAASLLVGSCSGFSFVVPGRIETASGSVVHLVSAVQRTSDRSGKRTVPDIQAVRALGSYSHQSVCHFLFFAQCHEPDFPLVGLGLKPRQMGSSQQCSSQQSGLCSSQ